MTLCPEMRAVMERRRRPVLLRWVAEPSRRLGHGLEKKPPREKFLSNSSSSSIRMSRRILLIMIVES